MKIEKLLLNLLFVFIIGITSLVSCSKNDVGTEEFEEPIPIVLNNEINDFIWRGLNEIYLWQNDVPNLSDTKFFNQNDYLTFYNTYNTQSLSQDIVKDYFTYLNSYSAPESLFDDLLYQKNVVDKFSFLVDDYIALENSFQGTSKTNGLDFGLVRLSESDDIFGYIRYVANNSDAASKNINRGEFFLTVDGQQLNINNYLDLLFGNNDTYTLGMADITSSSISLNGKTVSLTKTDFTENPILINKVIDANGIKVGYLMYNGFIANFDNALNEAISQLKSQGITELVLDLRYNPGGRVNSAIILSSMITGQFNGQIFSTEKWNTKYQAYFEANLPEYIINRFTDKLLDDTPITSLNLNKVYVLTTEGSASASELVINCLDAYIDVVQIGTNTTGKYTASVTLYDSPNFDKVNINTSHTYALQPLVLKSANVNGISDYFNGLIPEHLITYQTNSGSVAEGENLLNLGVLGDVNEPFLEKAISLITGATTKFDAQKSNKLIGIDIEPIGDSKDFTPLGKGMYKNL